MPEKLRAWLPFCSSAHFAAAACEACEPAHRVRWQDGATGLSHHSRCRKRAGCCSFLSCSRRRFEFSCRHNRSDTYMSACYSLLQADSSADRCFSDLCMRLCRCGAVDCCRWSTEADRWALDLCAVLASGALQRCASSMWRWQSTRHMHHSSEPTRCRHPYSCRTCEAAIRLAAVDAAVEAKEGSACSSGRTAAASRLPRGSTAPAAAHHS